MNEAQQNELSSKLKLIVKSKNIKAARELIDEVTFADLANAVNEIDKEEQLTFLRMLKTPDAAELFAYLDEEIQSDLAKSFTEDWGIKLLQELQSDELVDVLEELPANVTNKILGYTTAEKRAQLNQLLKYEEDEVGSIMSIDISILKNTFTCEQALNKIKRDYSKRNAELSHYYYVTDERQKLLGTVKFEEIVFAESESKIGDIYSPVASVKANDKKEYAAKIFGEHDLSVLPVTNNDMRLIGMITSDEVIDVIQDKATEDLYKISGINAEKANENEYIKTPWYKMLQYRLLWAVILFLLATITQIIIHFTLKTISSMTKVAETATTIISLAAIIPIVNNATSNGALQGNISVSRALSLNEIDKKDYKKVILKEFLIGLSLGLILALINVGRLAAFFAFTKDLINSTNLYLAIIIGSSIALFLAIIISKLFGAIFPIIFASFKKDPTTISVLLINTLVDIISAVLIFGLTYGLIMSI